ncbi:helix-turn-helix domain-containing protein [Asticcacaulis excentricus]|uniref:helix-turn-helix domain-containing protein n=1 Tax=Asticcacaulis excentricus TaxID=78587 RepID=UPI0001A7903D|nr:helix-turn-helix domain-containing protein [Asticcacaulis excentricus]
MAVRIMSDKELARFEVLRDLDHERLTAQAAADILGLSRRQTLRLLQAYRTFGVNGLVSKQRGPRSNRRKPDEVRAEALAIIRERYADSGR